MYIIQFNLRYIFHFTNNFRFFYIVLQPRVAILGENDSNSAHTVSPQCLIQTVPEGCNMVQGILGHFSRGSLFIESGPGKNNPTPVELVFISATIMTSGSVRRLMARSLSMELLRAERTPLCVFCMQGFQGSVRLSQIPIQLILICSGKIQSCNGCIIKLVVFLSRLDVGHFQQLLQNRADGKIAYINYVTIIC